MTDALDKPQQTPPPQPQQKRQQEQEKRLCDYCNDKTALLYCRADSAKLCFSCDREVHSTNLLFSKHSRSLLCDACDSSPASIFCETEHSVLCSNCDWEYHNQSTLYVSSSHNRRPIEFFTGCPAVNEMSTIFGFDDLDNKALFLRDDNNNDSNTNCFDGDGLSDLLVWETPEFVSIDDLIVSSNSAHNFQALDIPPLPKNRNAACGKHKEEMLFQLCQLGKLKSEFNYQNADAEPIIRSKSSVLDHNLQPVNIYTGSGQDGEPITYPAYQGSALTWFSHPSMVSRNHVEEISIVPDKHSNTGGCIRVVSDADEGGSQHPIITERLSVFPKVGLHELNTQQRDSALSRYKEKKKTRRYDKHIRYESRKARAESRVRIKGRFAKIDH
ncbi:zinc finger protein CONSTANS-LIKE 13-like [Mangifera indica]|uniref:zinc finger protein CONSTANS-LIKE 13-like n=1 Tax=Mangifera indica TaxID=29780 RepID=UPI001CFBE4A8|nr:zinc finger protein CONSTANS-LIKE 13-like [Mangifera indica]WED40976.1 CONSTANS-like 13B [Mangifera indica]